ncbi:MAG: DUF3078 domain-containing protein [Chitinophagaceae bacterium]|nr:DUF3078 domain-containing protein [Chitinophagaceae bacterium]
MIKPLILCLFLATAVFTAAAQDKTVKDLQKVAFKELKPLEKDGWVKAGTFIINVNQGALRNWAGGGEQNTLGFTTLLNYNLNHRKGKITWNNYFDIALGFQNASSFGRFRKIDDRIDITSKYGYQFSKKWYAAVLGNFNSQTLAGYNYTDTVNIKISNLLTPGKILLSAGIDFRPDKTFTLFVSPITSRFILKTDNDFTWLTNLEYRPTVSLIPNWGHLPQPNTQKKYLPGHFIPAGWICSVIIKGTRKTLTFFLPTWLL